MRRCDIEQFPMFSLSLFFFLSFSEIREPCLMFIFFQEPVGGLFREKLIIFSIKKFLRMKREKREREGIFHLSTVCRVSSRFSSPLSFLLFAFSLPFFSLSFFFFFFPFRYIISIDPPSALKHIKAFFTSQYVCIES